MKNIIIAIVLVLLVGVGIYYFTRQPVEDLTPSPDDSLLIDRSGTQATSTDQTAVRREAAQLTIGKSAGGRDLLAFNFWSSQLATSSASSTATSVEPDTKLLFIGGIHGGYEWNTSMVAYQLMDYLRTKPEIIPANVMVTVIPVLNPDGLSLVLSDVSKPFVKADVSLSAEQRVAGRFNGNEVDLNRNFDCDWQTEATWQNKTVSGGSAAFSEPESQAVRDYIQSHQPDAVVVWYSAAGGVFASSCHNGVLPETTELTDIFAKASGYRAYKSFDFYEITGDMVNWLAKGGTPAISILLSNHEETEWSKNQAGIEAILKHYAK